MEVITHWIGQYGYFGIFSLLMLGIVGLPVPDETLLTFAGFMVYKQELLPIPTFFAAFLGSICGITISYGLGRSLGFLMIHRYGGALHITQERMDRVHDWFGRVGAWGLLLGYFLPGVRHLTAIAAGASRLRPATFTLFACAGACLWVITFMSVGYIVGEKWRQAVDRIEGHLGTTTVVLLGLLMIFLLIRYRSKRSGIR